MWCLPNVVDVIHTLDTFLSNDKGEILIVTFTRTVLRYGIASCSLEKLLSSAFGFKGVPVVCYFISIIEKGNAPGDLALVSREKLTNQKHSNAHLCPGMFHNDS